MKTKRLTVAAVLSIGITPLTGAAGDSASLAKWTGVYDSVSGKCGELAVWESKITWGSCKEAAAKLISVSNSKLVMEVDASAAQCGWAGFIVALRNEADKKSGDVSISAYQGLDDYKADNRFVQCSYSRK